MLEGIGQLRKEIQILKEYNDVDTDELEKIADVIECEVEERYVEGPTDKDGEPITYDSMIERWGALDDIWCSMYKNGTHDWYVSGHDVRSRALKASEVTVVKPPTVEDVLEDYRVKYYNLVTEMECKNITNEEYVQGIKELNEMFAEKLQLKEEE